MVEKAKSADPEVKKQLDDSGFDFDKAFKDWTDRFGGLVDPKAKMTKQEKGLFLMEFGFRMMGAAGAGADAFEAAGSAGVPVLQGIQQRGARAQEQNAGVLSNAMKGIEAEGMMRRSEAETGIRQQQLELEKQKAGRMDASDIVWTTKGGVIVGPDGKAELLKGPDGQPMHPGMTPGAGNKPYANQWLYQKLVDPAVGGLSHQEAIQVVSGAMSPLEVNQRAGDFAAKELAKLITRRTWLHREASSGNLLASVPRLRRMRISDKQPSSTRAT